MTPSEIFGAIESPRRTDAFLALDLLLRHLAAGPLRAGGSHGCRIPAEDQEDVVQDILLSLIRRGNLGEIAQNGDAACSAYLRRSLANRWISMQRELSRERPADAVDDGPESGTIEIPVFDDPDERLDADRIVTSVVDLLERLFADHLKSQGARYHEGTAEAWADLKALVFDELPMEELVGLKAGEQATGEEKIRIRNAIFTRSKRLRVGMAAAVHRLRDRKAISEEDARNAESALLFLLRCQRAEPAHVRKTEDDAMKAPSRKSPRSEKHVSRS